MSEYVAIIARIYPIKDRNKGWAGIASSDKIELCPIVPRQEFTREELLKLADELEKP